MTMQEMWSYSTCFNRKSRNLIGQNEVKFANYKVKLLSSYR